jgi:hypothetical protein
MEDAALGSRDATCTGTGGVESQRKLILNATLWVAGVEVPKEGGRSEYNPADLKRWLDEKGR